jgi:hypothetical protein
MPDIRRNDVIRVPKSRLVRGGELERHVELAARRVAPAGAVLILIDSDDDPACELGPSLLQRAWTARPDMQERIGVVLATREYEAWLLASLPSLVEGSIPTSDLRGPESIRDAKGALRARLGHYRPTIDQARLTSRMDLSVVREAAPSFDKMWREVQRLLRAD